MVLIVDEGTQGCSQNIQTVEELRENLNTVLDENVAEVIVKRIVREQDGRLVGETER